MADALNLRDSDLYAGEPGVSPGFRGAQTIGDVGAHLEALRQRKVQIGPAEEIRVRSFLLQVCSQGRGPVNTSQLDRMITPLLATSAQSQAEISAYFAEVARGRNGDVLRDVSDPPREGRLRWLLQAAFRNRLGILLGVVVVVLALHFLLPDQFSQWFDLADAPSLTPGEGTAGGETRSTTGQPSQSPGGTAVGRSAFEYLGRLLGRLTDVFNPTWDSLFRLVAAALAASLAISALRPALNVYRYMTRTESDGGGSQGEEGGEWDRDSRRTVRYYSGQRVRYASGNAVPALTRLKLRRELAGAELDVERTVEVAASRLGIIAELIPRVRSVSVSHIVLVDRRSSSDHLGAVGDILVERLLNAEIRVSSWDFQGDASVLIPRGERVGGATETIAVEEMIARHAGAPVVVVSDGEGFVHPITGRPADWVRICADVSLLALFTPLPVKDWSRRERRLIQAGFRLYPATVLGASRYAEDVAEIFAGQEVADQEVDFAGPRRTLSVPQRYIYGPAPDKEEIDRLIFEVESRISREGFQVFVAVACGPVADPELTLYLGRVLQDSKGNPLLNDVRLAELSRLAWFREGHIPVWLCRALACRLEAGQLDPVRRAIARFVSNPGAAAREGPEMLLEYTAAQARADAADVLRGRRRLSDRRRDEIFEVVSRIPSVEELAINLDPDKEALEEIRRRKRLQSIAGTVGAILAAGATIILWPEVTDALIEAGQPLVRLVAADPRLIGALIWLHHGILLLALLLLAYSIGVQKPFDDSQHGEPATPAPPEHLAFGRRLWWGSVCLSALVTSADVYAAASIGSGKSTAGSPEGFEVSAYLAQGAAIFLALGLVFRRPVERMLTWEDVTRAQSLPHYLFAALMTAFTVFGTANLVPPMGFLDWRLSASEPLPQPATMVVWSAALLTSMMLHERSSDDSLLFSGRRLRLVDILLARVAVPAVLTLAYVAGTGLDAMPFGDWSGVTALDVEAVLLGVADGRPGGSGVVHGELPVGIFLCIGFWIWHVTRLGVVGSFAPLAAVLLATAFVRFGPELLREDRTFSLIVLPSAIVALLFGIAVNLQRRELGRRAWNGFVAGCVGMVVATTGGVFALGLGSAFLGEGTLLESYSDKPEIFDYLGAFTAFGAFAGWVIVTRRSLTGELQSGRDDGSAGWRSGGIQAYLFVPIIWAFSIGVTLGDNVVVDLHPLYFPIAAWLGAKYGRHGFYVVAIAAIVLVPVYSEFAADYFFGGLEASAYLAILVIAFLFARRKAIAPVLSAEAPQGIVPFLLVATVFFYVSIETGIDAVSISLAADPFIYVVGFLFGLGTGSLRRLVMAVVGAVAVAVVLRGTGAFQASDVYPVFGIGKALAVIVCLQLGRFVRQASFGDVLPAHVSLPVVMLLALPLLRFIYIPIAIILTNIHFDLGESSEPLLDPAVLVIIGFAIGYVLPFNVLRLHALILVLCAVAIEWSTLSLSRLLDGTFSIGADIMPGWIVATILALFLGRATHNHSLALRREADLIEVKELTEISTLWKADHEGITAEFMPDWASKRQ